ncbi:WbuC family cupin fold metalloprotein [Pseudoalteromonas sp. SR43-3]|uniref:WbuC family cupin fold metalloprotein n=1 Tax=Pseudoalteromonas sp. SR43-3 TaxID=2760943 RepID=UPI0015FF76E3|nr:WbuC family cupin fold metalloprotein [Pseudoalteromonas sp. SR43-3]MBB1275956.1 WbuC family cupin fold metalloprotein [Pseudoalteromonas sp. SR43-3]
MRKITLEDIDFLFEQAHNSSRKRAHLNLHASFDDKVQRLYIALLKDSYVVPHYHELAHQWEMFIVQSGVLKVTLYNNAGSVINSFLVGVGQNVQSIEFQPGDIHSVECVSEQALILEIKEGPFIEKHAKVLLNYKSN